MTRPRPVTDPRSGRTEEAHSYVRPDGTLNVAYEGQVPLRPAAKLGLAVEDAQGTRQAKTFFATEQRRRLAVALATELALPAEQPGTELVGARHPGVPLSSRPGSSRVR
ncbi:hypothetical protein [Streptomyces sp. IBSBF 3136]|uniref:hypothetical protein n=1 Tax=Streptomyces sp. IBSBF 3136 TaxID=2903524 RepID=UPI002FDC7858